MKRVHTEILKKGKQLRDVAFSYAQIDQIKPHECAIKNVINSTESIQTEELKQAINELEIKFAETKDSRYGSMIDNLVAIYEPRKQYKFLPVDKLNKQMLEILGDEAEGDPESVKTLRNKSIAIKDMLAEKAQIRAAKDRVYRSF